jgi:hypothetical protein
MGFWVRTMDGSNGYVLDYLVESTIIAGESMVAQATRTNVGETEPGTTTAADNFLGFALHAVTADTTPANEPTATGFSPENMARTIVNPQSVWRLQVSGGTASGTVLQPSTATPAHILSQDTASATVITDTAVGTLDMAGGIIKGRTGNNVGAIRKLSAQSDNTSTTVGIAFVNTDAVGDTYIRVPYSRLVITVQLTTELDQADGTVDTGTGAPFSVANVIIDEQNDLAWVDVVGRYHMFSPTA